MKFIIWDVKRSFCSLVLIFNSGVKNSFIQKHSYLSSNVFFFGFWLHKGQTGPSKSIEFLFFSSFLFSIQIIPNIYFLGTSFSVSSSSNSMISVILLLIGSALFVLIFLIFWLVFLCGWLLILKLFLILSFLFFLSTKDSK